MTEEQYQWLQSILGAQAPSEDDAADMFDQVGTIKGVALYYLRSWRAALLNQPTTVNISGAISVGYSGNLSELDKVIASVEAGPDDPTQPGGTSTLPVMDTAVLVPAGESARRRSVRW